MLFHSTAAAKMILYRAESGLFSRNPHNGKSCEYLLIFLLVLAIFVISVTLGAQNDQQVTFNYLLAQGEFRISTLLAVLFAAGFAIGWLICGLFWLRVRVSLARAERKIKRLEHQIAPVSPAAVDAGVPAVKE
ncbi:inner membrane protein yciS [Klebsiella pneumoniae]|uniref:Lipopolysaccharide assembly protein A n=1 Tax=Klebsiella pneumoniae TaxID=573 RepID=A0A377W552_KLEPN|nr:inner membrane protein yciS [Klebsiella pneumoniae]